MHRGPTGTDRRTFSFATDNDCAAGRLVGYESQAEKVATRNNAYKRSFLFFVDAVVTKQEFDLQTVMLI